jgi:hypothetical protein
MPRSLPEMVANLVDTKGINQAVDDGLRMTP